MTRTILVCGHGPGISEHVARKFGFEGYSVALVARNVERVTAAAAALTELGIAARAFPCDLANPEAVRALVREVRRALGPIGVLHWNAYLGTAGDLTTATTSELHAAFDVAVTGMVAAIQEALPDLRTEHGSVLATGGGIAIYDPQIDAMIVEWGWMGLAAAKAAQHKALALLHAKLKPQGVYVGEVVVLGTVKGTAFDTGRGATLDPVMIAERFWDLHQARTEASVSVR